jgi:hypothetical protein
MLAVDPLPEPERAQEPAPVEPARNRHSRHASGQQLEEQASRAGVEVGGHAGSVVQS